MAYDEFTAKMVRECERLEQENAQLKAERDELLSNLEMCKGNELAAEVEKLKAELAESDRKLRELCAAHGPALMRIQDLEKELAQCREEVAIDTPPGRNLWLLDLRRRLALGCQFNKHDCMRVLKLARIAQSGLAAEQQRAARLRGALEFIANQDKPGNWAVERAKRALEEDKA